MKRTRSGKCRFGTSVFMLGLISLSLCACSPDREERLAQELAEANAAVAQADEARRIAEQQAQDAKAKLDQSYAAFYDPDETEDAAESADAEDTGDSGRDVDVDIDGGSGSTEDGDIFSDDDF